MEYKTICMASRAEWRKWLKDNHLSEPGIWFTFYKKHTGKKSVPYADAVEEALCYGWIDSIIKKLDDERYIQKFTPRTNNHKWSPSNIARMKKLIKEKRMTKYGLSKYTPETLKQKIVPAQKENTPGTIPPIIINALVKHPMALDNFNNLAPSYRNNYIKWIMYAKKEETQLKRLEEAVRLLEDNKKLGLK